TRERADAIRHRAGEPDAVGGHAALVGRIGDDAGRDAVVSAEHVGVISEGGGGRIIRTAKFIEVTAEGERASASEGTGGEGKTQHEELAGGGGGGGRLNREGRCDGPSGQTSDSASHGEGEPRGEGTRVPDEPGGLQAGHVVP